MADFSLDLNEDQLQIQKWVHDFAEDVIRPAAHEWDEREETPWPIIEEAAKVGLYSMEFFANCAGDPAGLMLAIASEDTERYLPTMSTDFLVRIGEIVSEAIVSRAT